MEHYRFILDIGVILLATKLFSMLSKRIHMPQVVGALMAGLLLGPAFLGFLEDSSFIQNVASLGVIVLMFEAGLGTELDELKRSGRSSMVIALAGVLIPLAGGFLLGRFFPLLPGDRFVENLFLGVILTATSVSITVETLKELGKLSSRTGNAILSAALIDDVLGIIALTVVSGMTDASVDLPLVLLKIVAFIGLSLVFGAFFHVVFQRWMNTAAWDRKRFAVIGLAFAFLYAFVSEAIFGLADITGAYIAGLILSTTSRASFISAKCDTLSHMLLSPVFFASIGLKVQVSSVSTPVLLFTLLFILMAIFTKIVGCYLGARSTGFSHRESLRVGVGMTTRGEVGLVIADKGLISGVLHSVYITPVILMVTVTAVLTPLLLKLTYREHPDRAAPEAPPTSSLGAHYETAHTLSEARDRLLDHDIRRIRRCQPGEEPSKGLDLEYFGPYCDTPPPQDKER
jgi:Kef-type K+ transport system membrane component KefB